ncbi:hypothetical protein AN958_03171 [Leucoagaricus sp. SymC.cos]|nr:hypothetical protein AN958_03171 [Leucoagaricus sp. SymC.cos]
MDVLPSPGSITADSHRSSYFIRSSATPGTLTTTASTTTSFTTPRPSASTSTSNSDTDLSTANSTAATPLGTGTPTGVVVIPNRERSGTVIARPIWDTANNNHAQQGTMTTGTTTGVAPITLHPQRLTNLSNSTIVNGGGRRRPSSSHSVSIPDSAASTSPAHSTDTSRPDTETEEDDLENGDNDNDVDMEDTTGTIHTQSTNQSTTQSQSTHPSSSSSSYPTMSIFGASSSNAIASTSAFASTSSSPERTQPTNPPPPPPHRTRHSLSRRAVGIISENAPAGQTLPGIDGAHHHHHHIIINGEGGLGDLGVAGGLGVGGGGAFGGALGGGAVGVGVEDGIVSLDQQATEDFAMGAPPGAPGAIVDGDGTPRFGVGVGVSGLGVGALGRHHHGHSHHGHRDAPQAVVPPPDVTPRAAVIGLPPSEPTSNNSSPNSGSRIGGGAGAGSSTAIEVGMHVRGRSGTAPEPYTEPLITVGGPGYSLVAGPSGNNVATSGGASSSNSVYNAHNTTGTSTSMTNASVYAASTSALPLTTNNTSTLPTTSISNTFTTGNVVVPSPQNITATNTISSTASTGSNTTTPTGGTSNNTPSTNTTATPIYPGPYRDEDVLLGLQLLAYLSKYPHVRQAFYKQRMSFHPATVLYLNHQQASGVTGGMGVGVGVVPNGKAKTPMIPPPAQKDGSYFKTFNGSSVMAPLTPVGLIPVASGSGATTKSGKEKASSSSSVNSILSSSTTSTNASTSTSTPAGTSSSTPGIRQTNVFSLVERFTFKPSSSELAAAANGGNGGIGGVGSVGGNVPRLPPEIQYWAGVVMRNACRKDDNRGGIRQCANSEFFLRSRTTFSLTWLFSLPSLSHSALWTLGSLSTRIREMSTM